MTPPTRCVCLFLLLRRSTAALLPVVLCAAICKLMCLACAWMRLRNPTDLQHIEQGLVGGSSG